MTFALAPAPSSPTEAAIAEVRLLRARLPDIVDVDEARATATRAEAITAWARIAGLRGQVAFEAGELHVRAQRRAGQLLLELTPRTARGGLPKHALAELGITPKQSSRWQLLGKLPDEELELRLEAMQQADHVPSTESFLRAAHRFAVPMRTRTTPTSTLLRRALVALRQVRVLQTTRELKLARDVAAIGRSWAAQLDAQNRPASPERTVSCLLCGRQAPVPRPPRCPGCRGAWLTI